jgi:hypothetical protein
MRRFGMAIGWLAACALAAPAEAADDGIELGLAGTRRHYTVAEPVELALLYQNNGGNARGLPLEVRHADGKPKALLGEDAGTTAYRRPVRGGDVLLARMNRVVQRVIVK